MSVTSSILSINIQVLSSLSGEVGGKKKDDDEAHVSMK